MQNDEQLKVCPFCGCKALVRNGCRADLWKVECAGEQCPMCPATDAYKDKEAAVRAWNTRPAVQGDGEAKRLRHFIEQAIGASKDMENRSVYFLKQALQPKAEKQGAQDE
jgi:hypothetical protein